MKRVYWVLAVFVLGLFIVNFLFIGIGSKNITGRAVDSGSGSNIEIKGSDTLLQLVSNMAEEYSKENPGIKISVTGGGSGTGIAALINGEIDIADASRAMKDEEYAQAAEKGITPVEIRVAEDMLSVIVNPDNSIGQLTKEEIGKIFKGEITNWREVGGQDKEITLYGRQSTSGTYAFFMEEVLEGEYSSKMRNLEGNQAIVEAVKQDKTGIGYVGIGYIVDTSGNQIGGIKLLKVSDGGEYISPLDKSKMADYPVSRALYQYLAENPEEGSAVYDFVIFELSSAGQKIVEESGFVELTDSDKKHNEAVL